MQPVRRRDDPKVGQLYFRRSRIVEETDGFYYRTRGDHKHGPFPNKGIALFDLNNYLKLANLRDS